MKSFRWLVFSLSFVLFACQSNSSSIITIIDGEKTYTIESAERIPLSLLTKAGIIPQPYDRVLLNGILEPIDQPLPETDFIQLQLHHGVPLTVNTPQGQQVAQSSALNVGQALSEAGYEIYSSDLIDPPVNTPTISPMTITYTPAREMSIFVGDNVLRVGSSAGTVGDVLAEAGIPLIGFDSSCPPYNEAAPPDGHIHVVLS